MKLILQIFVLIFLQQIITSSSSSTQVNITGIIEHEIPDTNTNFVIQHSGQDGMIIDNVDAEEWDLSSESKCKDIVKQYFGRSPNGCYLREPTPWKLYPTFEWQEVTSVYQPTSSSYRGKTSTRVKLDEKMYTNDENIPKIISVSMEKTVHDKITHIKTHGNKTGTKGSTKFSVLVNNADFEMNYDHTWGTEETKGNFKSIKITNIQVKIPPYSNLTLVMSSYNVKATFDVTYSNSLKGYVTAHYDPPYNNLKLWGISTTRLKPLKNSKEIFEIVTLDFYTKGLLTVISTDLKSNVTKVFNNFPTHP